ncbi:heme o synthase [Haloarchaeobius iranensis]|uniref:Protoheme IX farnesyltransferase n=1 Tax=Haloarchaeobius iranensis TaxID=996166 RepID=A0A1G9UA25_9EURY|nr:heme o synthase [Haloarchaeobius iranensis]SDM56789.1 protoheme IX farnesyltransferase [Haloarchaeobius iranensis]
MDRALPRQLWSLVKPRIVALLCVTGLFALLAAGGGPPSVVAGFVVAGALIAASSAALNCWYDRELDRHMERTADRPLPSGRLDHRVALAFALSLFVAGSAVGLATLPLVAGGYMWLGVAAYVGLYTVGLKRRHWTGVVLGGSAGSFPVLAGWTAVAPLSVEAVLMAALVFAWTPAHAWALAHVYRSDFAAAGVPTLPVVADEAVVRRAVWYAVWATLAVAALLVPFAGLLYAVTLAAAGGALLLGYRGFSRTGSEPDAVRAFFTSNLFLSTLFVAWGVGGLVSGAEPALAAVALVAVPALFVGLWNARPALRGVRAAPGHEWRPVVRALVDELPVVLREYVRDNDHRHPADNSNR